MQFTAHCKSSEHSVDMRRMLLAENKTIKLGWVDQQRHWHKKKEKTISKLQFVSVATRQLPDANTTIVREEEKEQYYFKILK